MASELTISGFNVTYSKSGARVSIPISQIAITISGTVIAQGVVSAATAGTEITGLPTAPGYCYLRNLDATNYVGAGPDSAATSVKLTPTNHTALYPLWGTSFFLKANTAACNVQYAIFSI
jgi:hypothetical protein